MICPCCLRHVPKLIGRGQLCPDCFSIASEALIPEIFENVLDDAGWGETFPECAGEYAPEFAYGCVADELDWRIEDDPFRDDENPPDDPSPRFRGKPRFRLS